MEIIGALLVCITFFITFFMFAWIMTTFGVIQGLLIGCLITLILLYIILYINHKLTSTTILMREWLEKNGIPKSREGYDWYEMESMRSTWKIVKDFEGWKLYLVFAHEDSLEYLASPFLPGYQIIKSMKWLMKNHPNVKHR